MARVKQISDKTELPAEYQAVFDRIAEGHGGRVAGPYSILLHSPDVAAQVDGLSTTLRGKSELKPHEYVLAAIAVARAKDCLFVWSVQAPNARKAGLSEEAINAVRDRRMTGLSEDQADIVAYVQTLATSNRVDGALFERLKERYSVRWLVELTAVAGHFGLISGINNAFEVPPSPQGDSLPV